jgi:hypothetical protein
MELDLTEAVEALAKALHEEYGKDLYVVPERKREYYRNQAGEFLGVVSPILERQVRERVARELIDWADTFKDDNHNDAASTVRRTLRRHIHQCATRITPKMTIQRGRGGA